MGALLSLELFLCTSQISLKQACPQGGNAASAAVEH